MIFDNVNWLCWANTQDGADGNNKPKLLMNIINGEDDSEDSVVGFDSIEDFRNKWNEINKEVE